MKGGEYFDYYRVNWITQSRKKFFRNSQIPQLYGYNTVNKKELIINLCKKFYLDKNVDLTEVIKDKIINNEIELKGNQQLVLFNDLIWKVSSEWYEEQIYNNTYEVLFNLVNLASENYGEKIILDAVHNNMEWAVISECVDKSGIIYFNTPKVIRESRPGELNNDIVNKKNINRIGYWFINNSIQNLVNNFSWCINGTEDIQTNSQSFALLAKCIEKGIDICNLQKADLFTLKTELKMNYMIYNYKSEIIDDLCEEIGLLNQDNKNLYLKLMKVKKEQKPCYGLKKEKK